MVNGILAAEDDVRTVLMVAACRESYLVDYQNARARFTYNFADGAVAALLRRDHTENRLLASHMITDGSFSRHVKVPAGGSVEPPSIESVTAGRHLFDVEDPAAMKDGLDVVSLQNFVRVAERRANAQGCAGRPDIPVRHSHEALDARPARRSLGLTPDRATYLDDTGHMSGVHPLLALDRAVRSGDVRFGDVVLMPAAGTGYTWAASIIRWGP